MIEGGRVHIHTKQKSQEKRNNYVNPAKTEKATCCQNFFNDKEQHNMYMYASNKYCGTGSVVHGNASKGT